MRVILPRSRSARSGPFIVTGRFWNWLGFQWSSIRMTIVIGFDKTSGFHLST